MAWLRDEVWFDTDVLWFREQPRKPFVPLALESAFATHALDPSLSVPVSNGLEESRRRRLAAKSARRRRLATRTVPAMALVLGSSTMLSIAAFRPSTVSVSSIRTMVGLGKPVLRVPRSRRILPA